MTNTNSTLDREDVKISEDQGERNIKQDLTSRFNEQKQQDKTVSENQKPKDKELMPKSQMGLYERWKSSDLRNGLGKF